MTHTHTHMVCFGKVFIRFTKMPEEDMKFSVFGVLRHLVGQMHVLDCWEWISHPTLE